jgi:TonB-linked SusC/RagA family outer membrane protein
MIIRKVYNNLKRTMLLLLWLACSHAVLAQERVVSGSVKDSNGAGLAGVSVIVKGTTTGTNTNMDGKYSISAASNATLVFSFIGYTSKEVAVGNQSVIDVVLAEETQQLGEVVVTALGIERSQKALQSAVTKVPGVSLTSARENNFGASIQGRVAGVNVTKAGTGPAGSSRVIIRGNKSLGGSNQPLYVVDGIPMDNTNFGQAGVWGGTDMGDGLSSINPDDIESITVLKGANAAALYGSRGGYGVINITTKRGTARKGIGIEFNSNYVFEKVINYLDLQTEYGNGDLAYSIPGDNTSPRVGTKPATWDQAFNQESAWGSKLDGSPVIMWDNVTRPYSLVGDKKNFNSFFQTGGSFTNTLSLSGGSDKQTFRFSFSDMQSQAVIPNSGFNRKNVSLSTNGKFGKRVTFGAKILYSNEDAKNRPMVSDSPGNAVQAVMLMAPNYNVNDMKGDLNKPGAVPQGVITFDNKLPGYELQKSPNLWGQNPWWAAYQFINSDKRDRLITSGQIRFDITDFLYLQGKVGMDWYSRKTKSLVPQGTGYQIGGAAGEGFENVREINQEWMLGFDKGFGKVNVNAFVGGNKMTRNDEYTSANGSNFNVPFFASVNNTSSQNFGYGYSASGINSLYGSAEVSYGGFLYLTGTARNDWFSVLNPKSNSKLYPSIGASFVFTDAFKTLPKVISFGKVRASWGQVATANVGAYAGNLTYGLTGQGHLGRPMAGFSGGANIPNPDLVPALSTEIEFGAEMRFIENRLGFDLTYYDQKTTDDILNATISVGSGFTSTSLNIGELSNKGIELVINGTPVRGALTWDISLNLAKNKNKVIALNPGINELIMEEPRTRTVFIKNIVGEPFGVITGIVQARDAAGNRIYTSEGQVVQEPTYQFLGNGVADLTGGLNNSFTWKQFNLTFLIDFKAGGKIYSGTNVRLLEAGLTKESLLGRQNDLSITGVFEDGLNPDGSTKYTGVETRTLTIEQAENYWGSVGEKDEAHFTYDASFLKLRQLTFGYDLPASLLSKTPIKTLNLSFVARNLAILFKNTPNIDPENSYSSSSSQGLDYFGVPATRTYGFNLRATF